MTCMMWEVLLEFSDARIYPKAEGSMYERWASSHRVPASNGNIPQGTHPRVVELEVQMVQDKYRWPSNISTKDGGMLGL